MTESCRIAKEIAEKLPLTIASGEPVKVFMQDQLGNYQVVTGSFEPDVNMKARRLEGYTFKPQE